MDVGSAVGIFLAANAKCDSPFEIAACDISKNACDILKGKFPETQVFNKNVMDLGPSDYDIVTLWDTFEHITDPINLFEAISSQLRRDGLFVFSTPNTSSFEWKVMDTEHVLLLPPAHVNLYNAENIEIVLAKNDFSLVDLQTPNPSLDLSYLSHILSEASLKETPSLRAARILLEALLHQDLLPHVTSKFREDKFAGNMVVTARKVA